MKRQTKLYFQKTGILLAVYLVLRFLLPIVLPFFLAWITVGCLAFLQHKTPLGLMPLSILYLMFFLFLVGISVFCGCTLLYEPCCRLIPVCQSYWEQFSEYLSWLPGSLSGRLADLMPSVLSCLFGVFLYLLSVLLFARDWEHFHNMLYQLPFAVPVANAGGRIIACARRWLRAQFRIMIVISLECAAGYYLLGIPGFPFWAILTGIVDALPVFGTGTVFFPWMLIVSLQGDHSFALWLGLLYIITWLTREFLEPKLLGNELGLLPVCFLMSVIAGLQLFGPLGFFSGPFGVLFIRELWAELESVQPQKGSFHI
ncbi:MAG: AI-2E family transporter [Lachnospiraceae bacterium]|nr:AI-2E family transporter [Lachnospiraceae bacterium]